MSNGPDFDPNNALNPGGNYSEGSVTHGWAGFGSRTDPAGYALGKLFHHGDDEIPETPLQIAQANVAKSQWSDYQKRWQPVITYFKNRTDASQAPKKEAAAGVADADTQNKFSQAGQGLTQALRSKGTLAGSDKDVAATTNMADAKASSLGGGLAASQDAVDQQYMNALSTIVGIGRGQQVKADQSLNTLADLSGQQATESAEAAAQNNAGLGTAIGIGLGGAAKYGLTPQQPGVVPPQQQPKQMPPPQPQGLVDQGFGYSDGSQ